MTQDVRYPHNLEAELCTLGSLLLDNSVIDDVAPILKPEDFFRDSHQTLYRAILEIHGSGSPVDPILLEETLSRSGRLSGIGGEETIRRLLEAPPHSGNAVYYSQIVRQKAVGRGLIEAANAMIRDGQSNLYSADDLQARAEAAVYSIGDSHVGGDVRPSSDGVDEFLARLERRMMGEVTGLSSGIRALDDVTDGFQPGSLTIVGARPSMGKTALVLNAIDHVLLELKVRPFVVSMETSRADLLERMICTRAEVDSKLARNAYLVNDHQKRQLEGAARVFRDNPFPVDDGGNQTAARICANARRCRSRDGIGIVVVDYLQLIEGEGGGVGRQEEITKISRRLKQLAMELEVPVVAISQLNRQAEGREDRRPRMSDLRESGAIEQDADVVILLHRPEYYDPQDQPGVAELNIAKNRNGAVGTARLEFRKTFTKFNSL